MSNAGLIVLSVAMFTAIILALTLIIYLGGILTVHHHRIVRRRAPLAQALFTDAVDRCAGIHQHPLAE